ncbi:MAG TPA: hypothetical protein DC063_03745 [Arenimonas sp.]|nr:hypothetical protein [Candidatus Rokubacteria bacterium]HBD19277.1 hypothetical protein [Arenimonas sp.]
MAQLAAAVLFLIALAAFPPAGQAQEAVTYTATAPTTGNTPVGYQWWTKIGTSAWTVQAVAGADSTVTPTATFTVPVGVPHQVYVRAFDRVATPVMQGEQMVGVTTARRFGVQSPYGVPYTPPTSAPGGCGRPVRQ